MTTENLKSSDLVKIIEACGKNGVSNFKAGDIEIQFNGFVKHSEKDYPTKVEPILQNVQVDPNFGIQESSEVEANETENLVITDPLAYEEAIFKDELEESETHTDIE